MRKLRLMEHISLDGVIEIASAAGDHESSFPYADWTAPYRSPAGAALVMGLYGERFDLVLGRRTYDLWSKHWPTAPQSPMADRLNRATKYIVTHRPESLSWGPAQGIGPDFVEGIRKLKAEDGADLILSGSSTLTSAVLEQGLADEVILLVDPVLLGQGKRFLAEGTPARTLVLQSSQALPTGVMINSYRLGDPVQKMK